MNLTQLKNYLRKLFRSPTQGDYLEQYITRRHPKHTADVEHLERQYLNKNYSNHRGEWL